ncbi:uncharacterized protein PAC_02657 [Phialocephala subalpina]|uniref:Uncharacterized protein n=1 Tax=Phialocephala subalpina TaxID=576137 RepID=A0A1L7WJ37_9HELO|nr:uncharacterized protein PAC_02657 [Phialocephala subalpina]
MSTDQSMFLIPNAGWQPAASMHQWTTALWYGDSDLENYFFGSASQRCHSQYLQDETTPAQSPPRGARPRLEDTRSIEIKVSSTRQISPDLILPHSKFDDLDAELNEPQNTLAGEKLEAVEEVEEIEDIEETVNGALPASADLARKRTSTWRGQSELINSPYKASSIFKDEKLLETIKISEDSDTKIIRKTGLLGDHELELDLASDSSHDSEIQVVSSTDSAPTKETNHKTVTLTLGANLQAFHLMYLFRPSGIPDNVTLSLRSTFDVRALRRQLEKAQASGSGSQFPLWTLGFDTKVFGYAHRIIPTTPLVDNIPLTRLKASTEKKKFEEYIESLGLYKDAAWLELRCIFDPERYGINEEPSLEFHQLATAFFSGKEVPEECSADDNTWKSSTILDLDLDLDETDLLSGEPLGIKEQETTYKITNGTGDRAKVMAQEPLRDQVLATFLLDLMMSREIEKAIAQQARYKFMKVFHSSERSLMISHLENVEKSFKQDCGYLWARPGSVDFYVFPDGHWMYATMPPAFFTGKDAMDVMEPETRENATAQVPLEAERPTTADNSAQPESKSKKPKKKKKKPAKAKESTDSRVDPPVKVSEKTNDSESMVASDPSTTQHIGVLATSSTVDEPATKDMFVPEAIEAVNKGNGWQEVTKARAVPKTKMKASRSMSQLPFSSNARPASPKSASTIVNVSKSGSGVVFSSVANPQASTIDRRVSPFMKETAHITVPKIRQTRTQPTPTIVPPELLDSNFPPLSTPNEPGMPKYSLCATGNKIQPTLSITPTGEVLVDSPDSDRSSGKTVICNHIKQEAGQGNLAVADDLSWADLTTSTKFHPHQRYASLQTSSTRSKEEDMISGQDMAAAQMTLVRDSRVLSLQFGEVPVGYGLSLPETTREPLSHRSQSSDGSAKLGYKQTSSICEGDQCVIRSESPIPDDPGTPSLYSTDGPSQYYIPSPRFSPTIHGFTQDSAHLARGPRSHSLPFTSSTNLSTNSDELSAITELQQNGHPPEERSKLHSHPAKPEFVPSYFTCVCCMATRRPTPEAPVYFCPFCGPLTNVRYCSKACLLAESFDHRCHCANYPASQMLMGFDQPDHYVYNKDAILTLHKWEALPSRELFRQKTFSVYCFTGVFPEICKAWAKKSSDRADVYPADLDEPSQKISGDYHIFRSEISASGQSSPTEVLATFRIPETDPMKQDFNRLLNACFMFADMDLNLIIFLYRLIRHFILHDSYYRHSFPTIPREILYPEFRQQFKMEFGIYYNDNAEPPFLNFVEEWPLINVLLQHYEQSYPDLVIHLMRKLPYRDPSLPTPPL